MKISGAGADISVTGNLCPKGEKYAFEEITSPKRSITSVVEIEGGVLPLVSVKTASEVPKDSITQVMGEIAHVRVKAPVHIGDVIIRDVCSLGVSVVATKNVGKKQLYYP